MERRGVRWCQTGSSNTTGNRQLVDEGFWSIVGGEKGGKRKSGETSELNWAWLCVPCFHPSGPSKYRVENAKERGERELPSMSRVILRTRGHRRCWWS